jgi:hypothetical protein
MSEQQYIGNIYIKLEDFLNIQDGFSMGEKFAQIEKTASKMFPQNKKFTKNRFINLTDKEIYEALVETIKADYYDDEK